MVGTLTIRTAILILATIVSFCFSSFMWIVGLKHRDEVAYVFLDAFALFVVWLILCRSLFTSRKGNRLAMAALMAVAISCLMISLGSFGVMISSRYMDFSETEAFGAGMGLFFVSLPSFIAGAILLIATMWAFGPKSIKFG